MISWRFLMLGVLLVAACAAPRDMAPTERYTIFFEADSDTVNALGRGVVAQAASDAQGAPATRLVVVGFADRRGAAEANLALSQRRAEAVAKLLVEAGLPLARVSSAGRGEELVATEPTYGRRVVIERYRPE